MEPEYWAAIAAWVGVGVSWIYSRRAHQAAKDSAAHEEAAVKAQQQVAAAADRMADLEAEREAQRKLTQAIANVRAELHFKRDHPRFQFSLHVINDGPARAVIKTASIEGLGVSECVGLLNPNSRHRAALDRDEIKSGKTPWLVRIEWSDDRKGIQCWEQGVTALID